MDMEVSFTSDILCTTNDRKQWRSRKRQGKKKLTLLYIINEICSSSQSCLEWMKEMGFLPKVMFCSNCNKKMKFEAQEQSLDGHLWICKEHECEIEKVTYSVRYGTWFADKEISLMELLLLTYFWIHGFPEKQIMKELNMSDDVYYEWDSTFTNICKEIIKRTSEKEKISKTFDLSAYASRNPSVIAWLQRNRTRDLFIEFLKDADSLH